MTALATGTNEYLEDFARLEKREGGNPAWIAPIRKAAISRFAEMGFPTTRDEEWRFTNVAPIAGAVFRRADPAAPALEDIRPFLLGATARNRLVFVNGHFAPALSLAAWEPDGVDLMRLRRLLGEAPDALAAHLTRYADYRRHAFTALNTAFLKDGAFVRIPAGQVVEEPIHLLFFSVPGAEPTVSHPRVLIVAEPGSRATFVETYAGLGDGVYFTNAVTELVAGEGSVVDHYRVQQESEQAFHIGMTRLHQHRGSNLASHALNLGGGLVRSEVHAVLDGEGCDCLLHGLFVLRGDQHTDNHLRVEHARPHGNSREAYRGILAGRSRGVFTGRIVVHKGASKTDAKQTNMNLLLSDAAQIDSRPQLEIFADDVKCTHGATVGQVDEDAIFYLRSRGVGVEAARSLLVYAFAAEAIRHVKIAALRERLRALLLARLPYGHLLEELA